MTRTADTRSDAAIGAGILPQGLLAGVAHGVTAIASFLAIIGMIRLMGREGFGQFSLAIQITVFSTMIADFGIGPVIMRRMAIDPHRCGGLLADATVARLLLLLPTWVITIAVGAALDGSSAFFLILHLMLANAVISSKVPVLRGSLESFFRSQSRMGFPTITMALDAACLLVLVVAVPGQFHNPVRAMLLYTASNLPGMLLMLVGGARLLRRVGADELRPSMSSIRELLGASWPVALFLVLNALHVSIDSIYLKIFRGDGAVGSFNAALRIMTPLAVFPTIIAVSVSPLLARASVDDTGSRVRSAQLFSLGIKTLLAGSIAFTVFGACNSDLLLDLAFHGKYAEAALPMALLFVAFLPMSINMFLVEVNNARAALVRNTRAAAVLAAVSLTTGPPLILAFGVTGAVMAKAAAIAAALLYFRRSMRAEIQVQLPGLMTRSIALLVLTAAPLILLHAQHPVLRNAAAIVVFGAVFVISRFFTREEMDFWRIRARSLFGRVG
jgi:O-antigen/teichoic acid export membrane protein